MTSRSNPFYGRRLLFFLWIVYTIPIGFAYYGPVVLFPFMIEAMAWSRARIMAGSTGFLLTFGLAAPLTALMIRRVGARATIVFGGAGLSLAAGCMGFLGHRFPAYVFFFVMAGLCASLASAIPVQTVAIAWFQARRAMALGLVLGGGAVGGFLAPLCIHATVLAAGGNWRVGWFLIAGASAIAAVVGLLAVRNRPEEMGQAADGRRPGAVSSGTGVRGARPRPHRTTYAWTVREALRTQALWLLILAAAGCFFLWQVIVTQGPLHLRDRGFDPSAAAFFYSLAIGLSVAGRFAIAVLGDRLEPRALFAAGAFSILLGGILFWFVSPQARWVAYLYPLLSGFGFGAAYVCIPTLAGNYWGAEAFPGISGIVSPINSVFQALAAPLAGVVFDSYGNYFPVVLLACIFAAVGCIAILLCRPPTPPGTGTYRRHE